MWVIETVVLLHDIGMKNRVCDQVKCRNCEILWFEWWLKYCERNCICITQKSLEWIVLIKCTLVWSEHYCEVKLIPVFHPYISILSTICEYSFMFKVEINLNMPYKIVFLSIYLTDSHITEHSMSLNYLMLSDCLYLLSIRLIRMTSTVLLCNSQ